MSLMYVNALALNFRNKPIATPATLEGTVYLGQRIDDVEAADQDGWLKCVASIDGNKKERFVAAKHVRQPLLPNRELLVASVHREWMRFSRGLGKENIDPYYKYVGEMWAAIGSSLDGKDVDQPWSAAAISYMVREARTESKNPYKGFKFSAGHSHFIFAAIQARSAGDKNHPFWGYRLDEARPEVGDIICRDNPSFSPSVDYTVASKLDSFRCHTDIIMKIDSDSNEIFAIGGNVSHSVSIAKYALTVGGYASDSQHTFAILKNITDK